MALPSISTPEFQTVIPSTGETITYRPFLVKEEKILLMAMEGNDQKEIELAIKKILSNCILDEIAIEKLAMFDMEFLFLQLRGKSVGEVIDLSVTHLEGECQHRTDIQVNIDDIQIQNLNQEKKIMLTDDVGVMMKYPTMQEAMSVDGETTEAVFEILSKSVDYVFDTENVYNEFGEEEIVEWINGLNQTQFQKILKFFENMPKLSYDVSWKCESCGKEDTVVLEGIQSFFT
jgi:hypothetical protein